MQLRPRVARVQLQQLILVSEAIGGLEEWGKAAMTLPELGAQQVPGKAMWRLYRWASLERTPFPKNSTPTFGSMGLGLWSFGFRP